MRLRRKYLRGVYLVDLIDKIQSETFFLLTTKQLLGKLSDADRLRLKHLFKWLAWLRRINKGQWPWRLQ